MKCPIQLHAYHIARERMDIRDIECGRGECPFWDEEKKQCGAVTLGHNIGMIALALTKIERTLAKMENRMPHEGQFRR